MPTVTGQMQLQDYDKAVVVRGFDQFQPEDRAQMINFGYRAVARKFPWFWSETTHDYVVTPGTPFVALQGGAPASVDCIRQVYCITDPYRKRLEPEQLQTFIEKWLYLDLTVAQNWGITNRYRLYEGNLYFLPPNQLEMTFRVHFNQWLADLIAPTDVSAIPQVFDEIILDAALVRCHRRAHELELAKDAQDKVDEAIDEMLRDEVWQMEELQDRVLPDSQWL